MTEKPLVSAKSKTLADAIVNKAVIVEDFVIGGFQKTSLLDFPQKIACIVFTPRCNFQCGYCHNPELNNSKEAVIELPSFFEFLETRKGKLDGVVITGGEPTLQKGLYQFIFEIKNMGYAVKLDTNGSNPELLKKFIDEKLIDYVAMDIKAPFYKYHDVIKTKIPLENIKQSIDILLENRVDYEFRTTVVKEQLTFDDFEKIGELIKGAKKYYLQKFEPSKTLDPKFADCSTYSSLEFETIAGIMSKYVDLAKVR